MLARASTLTHLLKQEKISKGSATKDYLKTDESLVQGPRDLSKGLEKKVRRSCNKRDTSIASERLVIVKLSES